MIILAYYVIAFLLIRLLITNINYITQPFLPRSETKNTHCRVSVLIPARNEEKHIAELANNLRKQHHRADEILFYDDCSSDATASLIQSAMIQDSSIQLLRGVELPTSWLGKNFACFQLAQQATGDYFLFLDADVIIDEYFIMDAINYLQKEQLGLLSIFPVQLMKTHGERITVSLINWILLTLLPLICIKKYPQPSLSAAIGQCMLFEASKYRELSPHQQVKDNPVEDIAIARLFKQKKIRTDALLSNGQLKCRMYTDYINACQGFSKNILTLLGDSYVLLILFTLTTTFGWVVIAIQWHYIGLILYALSIISMRIQISYLSKQKLGTAFLYLFFEPLGFLGIVCYTLIKKIRKESILWKERII